MTATDNFLEETYVDETSTKTAHIETVKIHTNHIISLMREKCCGTIISNMNLNIVLSSLEYMQIHISMILDDIRKDYGINYDYIDQHGFVYFETRKQFVGLLSLVDLKQNLAKYSNHPQKRTHGKRIDGLWYHKTPKKIIHAGS